MYSIICGTKEKELKPRIRVCLRTELSINNGTSADQEVEEEKKQRGNGKCGKEMLGHQWPQKAAAA